ncbi:MAG: DMT family transporter [Prevotella sp.]|jgi:drug/metabolite transporter (DMT)-like permease|nr:DMT family transporter [Prevotella sp.]
MNNNTVFKGIILVAIGAASYGVLATFVKLGGQDGFSTAELTFSQAIMGMLVLIAMNLLANRNNKARAMRRPSKREKLHLMLGGIPLGLTSSFYYMSLLYVSVSVSIVLLMQSVWMGTALDLLVNRVKPSKAKLAAIAVVLVGTVLATNLLDSEIHINPEGIFWGLLAALSYTFTLFASNRVAVGYPALTRSLYMMIGSLIIITLVWGYSLSLQFNPDVLWKWGLILALFGTVFPPLFFTKGMPVTGVGLGSILASIELPVSVIMAGIVLHEEVFFVQWIGIALILLAVVLMNYSLIRRK